MLAWCIFERERLGGGTLVVILPTGLEKDKLSFELSEYIQWLAKPNQFAFPICTSCLIYKRAGRHQCLEMQSNAAM